MKKILYITIVFSQLILLNSCAKWLEESPESTYTNEAFYDTKDGLISSLYGVYERFADFYETAFEAWALDVGTDKVSSRQVNDSNGYHRYVYSASSGLPTTWYTKHYATIARACTVIANLDVCKEITDAERKEIEAECRYLRALCYFRMVQMFGPVPLVDYEFNETDNSLPRASVGDIYELIIEDLKFATSGYLPTSRTSEFTRVTEPAAQAILGKVYLTLASYLNQSPIVVGALLANVGKAELGYASSVEGTAAEYTALAIETLKPLIGTVAIENNYPEIFLSLTTNKNTNPEFLWQIQFNSNLAGSSWAKAGGTKANPLAMWQTTSGPGYQTLLSVPDNYYNYCAGDLRRDWNIAGYCYYNYATLAYNFYEIRNGYSDMAVASYSGISKFREYEDLYAEVSYDDPDERPTNYPYLRYSEVVFLCAEAELLQNGVVSSDTFEEINKIIYRARDGMTPTERLTYLNTVLTEKEAAYAESSVAVTNATNALALVADDPEVSQEVKDLLTAELATATTNKSRDNNFRKYAQYDVDLWTTGLDPVDGITVQQGLEPQPFLDYTISTFDMEALKRERQLELMFEGHRKPDLLRWGTLVEAYRSVLTTTSNQNGMGVISDYNCLFPIPLTQIEVSTNKDGFFQNYGF